MTDYLTEQEQVELLKNWIKQYSLVILAGIAVAVILMTGWRYWQQRQLNILTHASTVYEEMLIQRTQNNVANTQAHANKLLTDYPKTIYGQLAALMLAKEASDKRDYPLAESHFKWFLSHNSDKSFKQIARLRLARVLLAEHKPKESLATLETIDDPMFAGLVDEVRGDAYLNLKDTQAARESYKKALAELPNAETVRPTLQMKFDNLSI